MKRTSLIWKYLLIILASFAGALLLLFLLALYSVYVHEIPFLASIPLKNALYSFKFFLEYTSWVAWIAIGLVIFALLFIAMSLPTMLRIKRVSGAVRCIAEGDLSVRLNPRGHDELSSLEADVNAMTHQIEHAFQLQRAAEKSKDEFVMNIAHDLRTPLTSIVGYLSLIDERELPKDESERYTKIALTKAKQLSTLVNDLFDLLRMTPDTMKVEPERFPVKHFLLQVQDEAFPLLSAAGMELRLEDIPDDLALEADGGLLSRVYDNLILNAIRYASEGKFVDLSARADGADVVLGVTTHANPIPEDELDSIFDRLHRIETSRSSETGGAGLGLAICKNIINLHGGMISAARTVDGTRFEIRIPQQPIDCPHVTFVS